MSSIVPPQPLDVIQWVSVRLHSDGAVSTTGTIADKKMALRLLDIAREAIKSQVREYGVIEIPGSELDIAPMLPVKDLGYIPAGQRGDA